MNSHLQGKSLLRQSVFNMRHREYCDNHPASYGWTVAAVDRTGLVIWQKDGCLMRRHPAQDCWLLYWCECWQPIDLHVSELSARLEDIKKEIFWDVVLDQFEPAAMAA